MTTLAVIGGGITGLAAALRLQEGTSDAEIVVLEGGTQIGGKLRTIEVEDVQVETGADSFLARDDAGIDLCRRVGISEELVEPAVFGAALPTRRGFVRLPKGTMFGLPLSIGAALGAEPLSMFGKLRAALGVIDPRRLEGPDVSVADFVTRRYGRAVLEGMVDPILAGTRAGDPSRLSLAAALPQVDRNARGPRPPAASSGPPRFLAPRRGMSRLVEAVAAELVRAHILTGTAVDSVTRGDDGRYELKEAGAVRAGAVRADGVLIALPHGQAAPLLEDVAPAAAEVMSQQTYASVAIVTMVLDDGRPPLPAGTSGLLVPSGWGGLLSAATWWSRKWPHTTPSGRTTIRAFAGRSGDAVLDLDDRALVRKATEELSAFLGGPLDPAATHVTRWPHALPRYELGHLERIAAIDGAVGAVPGLEVAGADRHGSGIAECIASGTQAADRLLAGLGDRGVRVARGGEKEG